MPYTKTHRNLILTLVASAVLITASYAAFGWTDPAAAPPDTNIDIPLDTGTVDQIKTGGLKVKSLITTGAIGVGTDPSGYQLNVNGNLNAAGISISGAQKDAVWDAKEPEILGGTADQYWRGDKTWQTLNTTSVAEGTNLYFTNARASAAIIGGASTITTSNLTANRALLSDASGKVAESPVNNTELGYLTGVTSALQTQLNAKASLVSPKFSGNVTMPGTGIWNSLGKVGIGTTYPQSALHVPDGKYLQAEDNNAGAPPLADCDSNTERGRLSIDTTNNRLYICNGATRRWDWIGLND